MTVATVSVKDIQWERRAGVEFKLFIVRVYKVGRHSSFAAIPLLLDGGTSDRAIGTKHATVALLGLEQGLATNTLVIELARIRRHRFLLLKPAVRAGDDRLQDDRYAPFRSAMNAPFVFDEVPDGSAQQAEQSHINERWAEHDVVCKKYEQWAKNAEQQRATPPVRSVSDDIAQKCE